MEPAVKWDQFLFMKYTEVKVKSILNSIKGEDTLFGLSYNMNLYRGCEHQCIYCDTRSECYQIADFENEVLVKVNGVELLKRALPRKQWVGTIGFGSMNDPYTHAESRYGLTGQALEVIAEQGWPVHIITKSDLVLKDLALLQRIKNTWAQVSFSIATTDDDLASKIEPGAPAPSRRLKAMQTLAEAGIYTGLVMMPMLPYITDNQLNLTSIIEKAHTCKAAYIIPSFGMTLRDRQRAFYFSRLDVLFPGLSQKYESEHGNAYSVQARQKAFLEGLFFRLCAHNGLATSVKRFIPMKRMEQLSLFV